MNKKETVHTLPAFTELTTPDLNTFMAEKAKQHIAAVLAAFVDFYRAYFDYSNFDKAVKRINSGDCGTAAIASSIVLSQKYGIPVALFDNTNHAFFVHAGTAYDVANPTGTTVDALNAQYQSDKAIELSLPELVAAYVNIDPTGVTLIKYFVESYGLLLTMELQDVLDHLEDYDDPAWVQTKIDNLTPHLERLRNEHNCK